MNATVRAPVHFEKCGEIFTGCSEGERLFEMKCVFCDARFELSSFEFAEHIVQQHRSLLLKSDYELSSSTPNYGDGIQRTTFRFETNTEHDKGDSQPADENDPLRECLIKVEIPETKEPSKLLDNDIKMERHMEDSIISEDNVCDNILTDTDESECSVSSKKKTDNDRKRNSERKNEQIKLKLSDEQLEQLIEIYESFPSLWNAQAVGHDIQGTRKAAMKAMLETVEKKLNFKLEETQLRRQLRRIRKFCRKEKELEFKCERNDETYKPKCKFYLKTKFLYDHVSPLKCLSCSKVFKSFIEYKRHLAIHSDAQPFTCPTCQKVFKSVYNLNDHLKRHEKYFKFKCKSCKKTFISASDLKIHTRTHTGEKPFCCHICGRSFTQLNALKRHQAFHEKRLPHICELCKKGFYDKFSLKEHMNIHLNIRNKICKICHKAFTTGKYLTQHMQTHNETKKYSCKICSKSFAQNAGLFTHMKMH